MQRLVRTAIGPIKLGDLKAGRHRRLNAGEVAALFKTVDRKRGSAPAAPDNDDRADGEGYED